MEETRGSGTSDRGCCTAASTGGEGQVAPVGGASSAAGVYTAVYISSSHDAGAGVYTAVYISPPSVGVVTACGFGGGGASWSVFHVGYCSSSGSVA